MKKIMLALSMLIFITGCSTNTKAPEKKPVATITFIDGSVIELELYPEVAENTVNNFIYLANDGFYDGLIFHRIINEFMIQGGDPNGIGTGGPGYAIAGEFSDNGYEKNTLSHEFGVISMARSQDFNSAGSQFFITNADSTFLDGQYAAFGKLISGEDVLLEKSKIEVNADHYPLNVEAATIKTITVETFNHNYPEPKKVD